MQFFAKTRVSAIPIVDDEGELHSLIFTDPDSHAEYPTSSIPNVVNTQVSNTQPRLASWVFATKMSRIPNYPIPNFQMI